MLAAKFFSLSHDEDQEAPWLQNLTVYKHSSFFNREMNQGKFCLQSQFAWTKLYSILVQLVSPLMALKIILIYVYGCEKRKPKHIPTDWMKKELKNLFFVNLDKYPICREVVEPRDLDSFLSLDRYRCLLSSFNEQHFHTWFLDRLALL